MSCCFAASVGGEADSGIAQPIMPFEKKLSTVVPKQRNDDLPLHDQSDTSVAYGNFELSNSLI